VRRLALAAAAAVVAAALLVACGDKKTTIQGSTGGELANNGFPAGPVANNNLAAEPDPVGDGGFFNGQPPGGFKPFVDITASHRAIVPVTPEALGLLGKELACGPATGDSVVFCPAPDKPLPSGDFFFFSMTFAGDVPHSNTPGQTIRYSVFIDAGGGGASDAGPGSPDLANAGTNMLYQLIMGQPAKPGETNTPSTQLFASDRRPGHVEFPSTAARAWVHQRFVFFAIPTAEIGSPTFSVRGGSFVGAADAQGDATKGGQDVVPGRAHAPFGALQLGVPISPPSTARTNPAAYARNKVLASCLQLTVQGNTTFVIPEFLVNPLDPGPYKATFDTGAGKLSGGTTVEAGAKFVAVPVKFTQFTRINGVTLDGPSGAIDPGTLQTQLPFDLNASTDHATDCDGNKLTLPPLTTDTSTGSGVPTDKIAAFLNDLAQSTRTAAGVDHALALLNGAVVDRYSKDTCRSFLQSTVDPTAAFSVVSIAGPGPYTYASDGQSTVVNDVFEVTAKRTVNGQTSEQTVHVARNADGTFSWFTRCKS
jgi:hypothetical protein